jgi:hypothetical protein
VFHGSRRLPAAIRLSDDARGNPKLETKSNDQEEKSDNSPPRRGERGKKSFLFEKYSELCELCVSVVKSDPEVSDFDIRISDFVSQGPAVRNARKELQ